MVQSSITNTSRADRIARTITIVIIALIVIETALVALALVPTQLWARILPQSTSASLDGPFPPIIAPAVTALLYLAPTITGFLCRNWQRALLYATLPAWIGLGLYLVAATFRVGIFDMISADHVTANASMLELFAILGGLGWLARSLFKMRT